MLNILAALAPVLLVILLGFGLYRSRLMGDDVWSAVEHLCYYLLFPCLIVRELATSDFSGVSIGGLIAGFLTALAAACGLLIVLKPLLARVLGLKDSSFTSLFQGSTRWHGFIALAIATALYGPAAVTVVAVGLAVLVPPLNIVNVAVLARWGEDASTAKYNSLIQMAQNPFIHACLLGAFLNVTGIGLPEPLLTVVGMLASGALGLSLMTIGAGLRPLPSYAATGPILFGIAYRLLFMPALFFVCLTLFGISGETRTFASLCGAVPTAASAYVLARKMGGDAPLMASMITAQVLAAALTLPLVLYVLERLE